MPEDMRSSAAVLCAALAGCDPGLTPGAGGEVEEPPAGPRVHALTLPAVVAAEHSLLVYAELAEGEARVASELDVALADGYPTRVRLGVEDGYVVTQGCAARPGAVVWKEIVAAEGEAAGARLVDGGLVLELAGMGTTAVTLVGEIADQACEVDGVQVTTMPLRHEVVVRVRGVAGVVVESFHRQLHGCAEEVVLPADAALWSPTARLVDPDGEVFDAINAPVPVTITLESAGALTAGETGRFSADPGEVAVIVDGEWPVDGLRAFTVVGPDALTAVDAGLYLEKAAAKGTVREPIVDGGVYPLFFPELRNTVEVEVAAAETGYGPLCANVPAGWFVATSATSSRCPVIDAGTDEASDRVAVAEIRALGECRLEVGIRGGGFVWSRWFRTTI